jgi:hypothetical protein
VATNVQTFGAGATFGRFFGNLVSNASGYALGTAVGGTLQPGVQDLANLAWQAHPTLPVDAVQLAMGVAQGQVDRQWAQGEALLTGINGDRFARLVHMFDTGPGVAQAFSLWRRGEIDEAGFRRAAKREGLEQEWINALVGLKRVLLTPDEAANARQQQFIGEARQKDIAAHHGITDGDAEIQFLLAGLPPGVERALQMARRGIIDRTVFGQIVAEGHEKTKYTDEEWALLHEVVPASTYAELHLRGWIDQAEMNAGGALTGYRPEDMQRLFHARGRPATTHQAFIGVRRGGSYDGPTAGIPDYFQKAVRQSNIRDEWLNILWAQRHSYPSAFVLRGLTQNGDLTQAEAHDVLLKVGWEPELATKVSARWAGGAGTEVDPHIGRAETQLWTTTHSSYINNEIDDAAAQAALTMLGVTGAAQTRVLNLWRRERSLIRRQLTPTQIRTAFRKAVINPETGVPWTRDDAVVRLEEMGYDSADVNTFLDE